MKKLSAFRLSEDATKLLKLLSEKHNRSQANMIETLIKEQSVRDKIKLPE